MILSSAVSVPNMAAFASHPLWLSDEQQQQAALIFVVSARCILKIFAAYHFLWWKEFFSFYDRAGNLLEWRDAEATTVETEPLPLLCMFACAICLADGGGSGLSVVEWKQELYTALRWYGTHTLTHWS